MSTVPDNERAVSGSNSVDASELTDYVERWEEANVRIKEAQEIRKEIKAEAKSRGFCVKSIGEVVKLRAMDPDERHEKETTLDVYKMAMGL